jgi:hypothetical protein
MDALIRCTVKPGNFSTEFAVTISSTSSGPISFFVDRSFVEFSGDWPNEKGVEGGLKVVLLKQEPDYSLIQLPPQSSLASRVRVPKDSFLANSR